MQTVQHWSGLRPVLDSVLSKGLELTGTVLGNVQLMDWRTGCLSIAAQCGFNDEFLNFFRYVDVEDGSACARAIRERRAIVVEDVLRDWEYAPCRTIALESGYRAVQSTPLISSSGTFVGVLSTHFATPHRPSTEEMLALSELAESTANVIILRRRLT
jgi:GAF domain-containing protein